MGILLPIIIAVLVLLMLLIVFVSKYQTAKPDEALIISGSYLGSKNVHVDEGGNKIKIVRGGGGLSYQCSNVQIELVCFQVN
ncbi:hypothetical protein HMPREF9512_01825 [Enterococcus faecalis EnGen0311]|nr:hypothetical protein HMPREF9512_01825 [Enterococcus faecalis EnGen0311]